MIILAAAVLFMSSQAIELTCMFNNIAVWTIPIAYTGSNCTMRGSGQKVSQIFAQGNHRPGQNHGSVRALIIDYEFRLGAFPENINNILPALTSIGLHRLSIRSVSFENLEVFPLLVQIDLSNNEIETIAYDVFAGNPNLRAVDLSQNPLRHIGHYVFTMMTNLQFLELNDSGCIDTAASSTSLEKTKFSVILKCPPTSTMIKDEVLASATFTALKKEIRQLEELVSDKCKDEGSGSLEKEEFLF